MDDLYDCFEIPEAIDNPEDDDGVGEEFTDDFLAPDELPISVSSCWLLNRAYQLSLKDFQNIIIKKLDENRAQQEELLAEEQANDSSSTGHFHPNSLLKFMAPYFRDCKGLTPGDNDDVKLRKLRGDINISYMKLRKSWREKDRQTLIKAIQSVTVKSLVEPLHRKEEDCTLKIKELKDRGNFSDEIERLKSSIEDIRAEIDRIKLTDPKNLLYPRSQSDKLDWFTVSTRMPPAYTPFVCEIKWTNELHPDINHDQWTSSEDKRIEELVEKYDHDWDTIADELKTNRVAWMCCSRYQSCINEKMKTCGPFSVEELALLKKVVNLTRLGDYIPWNQVAYFIEGRTMAQVKLAWKKQDDDDLKGAKWNKLEDDVLITAVNKYGDKNWRKIAYFIPGRTNRQCRERYKMRLGIKDRKIANWTQEEDENLIKLAPTMKFRWVEMMNHILRRNSRQIAARYDLLERKKIESVLESSEALQKLVPRKKALPNVGSSSNSLLPSTNVDEFLIESRKKLEEELVERVPKKSSRLFLGGRKKKTLDEAQIDKKITQLFANYNAFNRSTPFQKYSALTGEDGLLLSQVKKTLEYYLNRQKPQNSHLLSQVVDAALTKQVIGLDSNRLDICSPILPPNIATSSSFHKLLLFRDDLKQKYHDENFDDDTVCYEPEYKKLFQLMISFYFWPCVLASNHIPSKPIEQIAAKEQPVKQKGRKRKSAANMDTIHYVNQARARQKDLFATAKDSLLPLIEEDNNLLTEDDS